MEVDEALSLIEYALGQRTEELLYQRWLVRFQFEMSFDEFKLKLKPVKLKDETEILEDVEKILSSF